MKPHSRRQFLQTSGGIGLGLLGPRLKTWAARSEPIDALVIGSGFGGAIAALRLAQAGVQTVVLERGRRWPIQPPNPSLPDFGQDTFATFENPDGRASWLSDVTNSLPPIESIPVYTGVLELITGNGIVVRAGAGVGGGSLVYNAILLQPRKELFQKVFPRSIDYDEMDQVYYPRVRTIVNGSPTPNYIPPDILATDYYLSTRVNFQQAQNAGFLSRPPKLVEYGVDFNIVRQEINGQARPSAIGGESWYGLNSGAKNSVDHNYLKMAEATGKVQVLPLHVVTGISHWSGEKLYIVTANQIDTNGTVLQTVNFVSKRLFMAAGSMGTSALLVRAKATGTLPKLSNQVGQGWGNNGDFILLQGGLANGNNNAGTGGPCGHFVFEDLNNPYSPTDMVELVLPHNDINSFASGSSLYVGLGLAPAIGYFTYDNSTDSVTLNWPATESARNTTVLNAATSFVNRLQAANPGDPGDFTEYFSVAMPPALTAHPVGGATMGRVCDQHGRVYGYPGLYIVDGAIVPGGSVGGVNPSFTIAALAERSMARLLQHDDRELARDRDFGASHANSFREPEAPALQD